MSTECLRKQLIEATPCQLQALQRQQLLARRAKATLV